MGRDMNVSKSVGSSPSPRRRGLQNILKVVNGVLVGVGALYLATGSVVVTAIGAVVAVALVGLCLAKLPDDRRI
jgi:hypothetical protein